MSNDDIRVLLARRKATQPIGEWSCGSVFTNPPGDHAARLIDSAGLKGIPHRRRARVGDAREFHRQRRHRERRRYRAVDRARPCDVERHGVKFRRKCGSWGRRNEGLAEAAGLEADARGADSGVQCDAGALRSRIRDRSALHSFGSDLSPASSLGARRSAMSAECAHHQSPRLRPRSGADGRHVRRARSVARLGPQLLEALLRKGVDAYAVDGIPALVQELIAKRVARASSTSCTAIRAAEKTACCRVCSTRSTCHTRARTCSARRCRWTRSARSKCGCRSACRRRATHVCRALTM